MATDAEIRERFKYIPKQEYLKDPFILPVEEEIIPDSGVVNTNAFVNSGGNNNNNDGDDDENIIKKYTGPYTPPKDAAKELGKMFIMGGPQAYIMQKLISKGIGAFKDYRNKNKVEKYTGQEMSSYRDDRPSSEKNYTGGDTNSNPSTSGAQDSFSNKSGVGRTGYFFGGRAKLQGGGMSQGNEENQKQSAEMGNTTVSNNNDGGGNDNPPNFFVEDKTSIVDTSGLTSRSPKIGFNYTDPKNYASLKGSVYNKNILDNDDINVDGTLSGEIGPVSYNTNFTDQGITNTNLTAGNFNADIDANKNYSLGYANNYNGIDYGAKYDNNGNLMFSAGVNFKNGGLAGLL